MKQHFHKDIQGTIELLDTEFPGSGFDLTESVLRGIEREKQVQLQQRQRNATLTAVLFLLILLNVFMVQTAIKQMDARQTTPLSQTSGYAGLEEKDITIQINKKIAGFENGK